MGEGDHDPEALRWAQEALYQEELRRAALAEPHSNGWEQEARYQEELRRAAFADPNSHSHLADQEALISFESIYRNSRSNSNSSSGGGNGSKISWSYDSSSSISSSGTNRRSTKSTQPSALPVFASSFSEPGYWRVGSSTNNSRYSSSNNNRNDDNSSSSSSRSISSGNSSRMRSITSSDTYSSSNGRKSIEVATAPTASTSTPLVSFAGVRGVGNHSGVEPGYVPKHHHPSELAKPYSPTYNNSDEGGSGCVENGYNTGGVTYVKSWRLNERHYGALQGLEKNDPALVEAHGESQVLSLCRLVQSSFLLLPWK